MSVQYKTVRIVYIKRNLQLSAVNGTWLLNQYMWKNEKIKVPERERAKNERMLDSGKCEDQYEKGILRKLCLIKRMTED